MKLAGCSTAKAGGSAILVAIVLSLAIAVTPDTAGAQGAPKTSTPGGKSTVTPPPVERTKFTASGLLVNQYLMGMVILNGEAYRVAKFTQIFGSAGKKIAASDLKKNEMVNIEYYQGGKPDEQYPFEPIHKVLITLNVVGKKK